MNRFNYLVFVKLFIVQMFLDQIKVNGVVVNDIKLLSSNGKTDYVLSGESYHLTCLYMLEPNESVLYVQWDLLGHVIYIHKTDLEKPVASGIFTDRVDYTSKSTNSISIRNATKEMSGRYSCHVFTNLTSTAVTVSRQIYIIIDSCTQDKWKTHSDMINCKEQIQMRCDSLYPKPITACSLHNDYTDKIIKVETINRILPNKDYTFNLSIFANYDIEEIKALNAPVSFRCKLRIEGTSWRKSFVHSLFAESVCLLENDQNSVKNFLIRQKNAKTYLFNEKEVTVLNRETACLIGYREGSILKANCRSSNPLLLCINATWIEIDQSDSYNLKTKLKKKEKIDWTKLSLNRDSIARCNSCYHHLSIRLVFMVIIISFLSNFHLSR